MSNSNRNRYNAVYTSQMSSHAHHSRRRKRRNPWPYIIIAAVLAAAIAVFLIMNLSDVDGGKKADETSEAAAEQAGAISSDEIMHNAVVDLSEVLPDDAADDEKYIYVQGMTPAEISRAITDAYDWSLEILNADAEVGETVIQTVDANATTEAATMGDEDNPDGMGDSSGDEEDSADLTVAASISVPDYIAAAIPDFIQEIVDADGVYKASAEDAASGDSQGTGGNDESAEETEAPVYYVLALGDLDERISGIADFAATMWYVEPQGGSIGSYDADNDKFIMESSKAGYEVDKEELIMLLSDALSERDYTASIDVPGSMLSAESFITVGNYQTIATYTTKTTSNSVRNKNIQLACEAVNGTIVRPGEIFSFNDVVGQRTEEKGYGAAAAYNNGEVVQEIGGGVCQVSSTLYNAVVKAGLKTTSRQSHTFKPTYVTPGQDATISWGGPDYKFANTPAIAEYSYSSSYAIGIRATYSDQTCTVSIYGRPVLKSGYTYEMDSVQTKELELVRVLITPGDGREPATGTKGSVWESTLYVKKDGEVIQSSVDHLAYYTGHTEYYYETSEEETAESADEIISDNPPELAAGDDDDETVAYGPGGSSTQVIETVSSDSTEDTAETTSAGAAAPDTSGTGTISDGPVISSGSSSGTSGDVITSAGPGSL